MNREEIKAKLAKIIREVVLIDQDVCMESDFPYEFYQFDSLDEADFIDFLSEDFDITMTNEEEQSLHDMTLGQMIDFIEQKIKVEV